jgi:hypothetical protein
VRSARESDFMLLRPLGRVPLAFSGANPGTLRTFAAEVRAGRAVDASYDAAPQIYRLAERRRDARNFYTTPAQVAELRPAAPAVPDIGLRFGPLPTTAGAPAPQVQVRFSRTSLVTVAYVPAREQYEIRQDGTVMPGVAPANVLVQRVRLEKTPYRDVLGLPTPYTVTTGTGEVIVLRDGRSVPGTWRRTTPESSMGPASRRWWRRPGGPDERRASADRRTMRSMRLSCPTGSPRPARLPVVTDAAGADAAQHDCVTRHPGVDGTRQRCTCILVKTSRTGRRAAVLPELRVEVQAQQLGLTAGVHARSGLALHGAVLQHAWPASIHVNPCRVPPSDGRREPRPVS